MYDDQIAALEERIEALANQLAQVDEVLMLRDICAVDGDYKTALHHLISAEIGYGRYFVAEERKKELATARTNAMREAAHAMCVMCGGELRDVYGSAFETQGRWKHRDLYSVDIEKCKADPIYRICPEAASKEGA